MAVRGRGGPGGMVRGRGGGMQSRLGVAPRGRGRGECDAFKFVSEDLYNRSILICLYYLCYSASKCFDYSM